LTQSTCVKSLCSTAWRRRHEHVDETVYGLSGTITFTIDGVPHKLGPGDVLHVPRGVIHGFAVSEEASILAISTPGLFTSTYMQEMADVLNAAGDGPPRSRGPGRMLRHGLTPRPAAA
jgi:quercetin dioxygenase-like cupin family protein